MKNRMLKYIPKALHKNIVGNIDIWKNYGEQYYCIDVEFKFEDGSEASFVAHGVQELKWACKQVEKGKRGNLF